MKSIMRMKLKHGFLPIKSHYQIINKKRMGLKLLKSLMIRKLKLNYCLAFKNIQSKQKPSITPKTMKALWIISNLIANEESNKLSIKSAFNFLRNSNLLGKL